MDKVMFTVNGDHYTLTGSDVTPEMSLNDYIRNSLGLYGTKAMCHEGGCGACIVSVSRVHPATKEHHIFSVNSCLVHVLSCHQWDITTVEGLGNRIDGYHPIQHRLASFNGTQCGYCSPGWVMNMYSLFESQQHLTLIEVENSFAGNMCRCTGYRPILDAFKSFATDADDKTKQKVQDLEDLHKIKCLSKCNRGRRCSVLGDDWCVIDGGGPRVLSVGDTNRWYKAYTVNDVFAVLDKERTDDYRLIAGNTGRGVYPIKTEPRVMIDISSISSIKESIVDVNLVLGAGMTLSDVMATFKKWSKNKDFKYLDQFYEHLDLVAHVPVRNIGTIGGNLAMKNAHNDFPSDVFLLFETVGATVAVVLLMRMKSLPSQTGSPRLQRIARASEGGRLVLSDTTQTCRHRLGTDFKHIINNKMVSSDVNMQDFLTMDLKYKIITNVQIPPLSEKYYIRTYKIMPRAQNAHAIVNAGFLFKLVEGNVSQSIISFGSINSNFIRAKQTENYIIGNQLFSNDSLQGALKKLNEELAPDERPPDPSPSCRKTIALGLFYKALLSLCPDANPRFMSGGQVMTRGVSHGTQVFDTDKSLWPLNQPVTKLEALAQCSGDARYVCDVTLEPRDLHLAFVLSDICLGEIVSFDASEALNIPGVVAFLTAKDISGKNSFTSKDVPWIEEEEEILASKRILYYGQPVGIIAAVTHKLALRASDMVKVIYKKDEALPVLSVDDVLKAPDKDKRLRQDASIIATDKGTETTHTIKGTFTMGSQYHYTMETQSCTVSHTDNGVRVRSATQWADLVHVAVARCLGLDENCVEVAVPRVGGAYGGKASRAALCACACATAARALRRGCSLVMPLRHNTLAVGKRQPCTAHYEVGVNDSGMIQYVDITYYSDCGCSFNDTSGGDIASTITNTYESSRWTVTGYSVLTDTPSNTWCRAPSTTEGTAIIEHIMERIAFKTKIDPITIRTQHLSPDNITLKEIIMSLKTECQYEDRMIEIQKFNSENAWRKRALKLSIMSYPISYFGNFPVTVNVYHADGTVGVAHGGIEMGQGINTKVAQVCAYTLKVPLEKVTIRGTDTFVSPNAMCSNGSITSELIAHAVVKACDQLLQRLEPVREEQDSWELVIKKAYDKGVNLQSSAMTSQLDELAGYSVYGACAAEVELDVISGVHALRRVDLLEDTGVSMSPDIDVGQVEGAFVMGVGLWTTEQVLFARDGRLLTDNTWTYKPPGVKDIPVDFRVSFRRNSYNTAGVLRSKATGEPALVLSVVVTFALHEAVLEARKEFGYNDTEWVQLDTPCTVENILQSISPKLEYFKLY